MNGYFEYYGTIINLSNVDKIILEKEGNEMSSPIIFYFMFSSGGSNQVKVFNSEQASIVLSNILKISKEEGREMINHIPAKTSVQPPTPNTSDGVVENKN